MALLDEVYEHLVYPGGAAASFPAIYLGQGQGALLGHGLSLAVLAAQLQWHAPALHRVLHAPITLCPQLQAQSM